MQGPSYLADLGVTVPADRIGRLVDDWAAPNDVHLNWRRWFHITDPSAAARSLVAVLRDVFEVPDDDLVSIEAFSA